MREEQESAQSVVPEDFASCTTAAVTVVCQPWTHHTVCFGVMISRRLRPGYIGADYSSMEVAMTGWLHCKPVYIRSTFQHELVHVAEPRRNSRGTNCLVSNSESMTNQHRSGGGRRVLTAVHSVRNPNDRLPHLTAVSRLQRYVERPPTGDGMYSTHHMRRVEEADRTRVEQREHTR